MVLGNRFIGRARARPRMFKSSQKIAQPQKTKSLKRINSKHKIKKITRGKNNNYHESCETLLNSKF